LYKGYFEEITKRLSKEYASDTDEIAIKELERQIRKTNFEIDRHFDLFYKAENYEFRKRTNDKATELEQNKKILIAELARLKNNQTKRMTEEEMLLLFINILHKRETEEDFAKFLIKEFVKSVYVSEEEITIYYHLGNDNEPHKISKEDRQNHKKKAERLNSASPSENTRVRISSVMVRRTIPILNPYFICQTEHSLSHSLYDNNRIKNFS